MNALTYRSYLCIDELLALQRPQSQPPHHDEMLFIVIHQVYELWFKVILHELQAVKRYLADDEPLRATRALGRVHAIQRVLEQQVDVLETMTPHEFNAFRNLLNPASGFQSVQFRELEVVSGAGTTAYLQHLEATGAERRRLDERFLPWRSRHVRMVERMIGQKSGTGGSLGVRYLETTLSKKSFPELWEVRTALGGGVPAR